jgi:hypothetical protein
MKCPNPLQACITTIANQAKHHRKVDFKKEFVTLLKRHEIDFEERHLWD